MGTTHASIVNDETKDVLMEYYAPWCGHCKKLEPIWNDLAKSVVSANVSDLIVGKMDGTKNEVKGLELKSFPTLVWYPRGNKAGVAVKAQRTLAGLKEFLGKNSESYM